MLRVKQGGIKYHFLSLWYDSTWGWTLVSWTFGEHSTHSGNGGLMILALNPYKKQHISSVFCVLSAHFIKTIIILFTDNFGHENCDMKFWSWKLWYEILVMKIVIWNLGYENYDMKFGLWKLWYEIWVTKIAIWNLGNENCNMKFG